MRMPVKIHGCIAETKLLEIAGVLLNKAHINVTRIQQIDGTP